MFRNVIGLSLVAALLFSTALSTGCRTTPSAQPAALTGEKADDPGKTPECEHVIRGHRDKQ